MTQSGQAVQGSPDRHTWRPVEVPTPANGLWLKWEQIGDEVEGEWQGMSIGKFGEVGTVLTASGPKKFSLPVTLARQLRRVPEGTPTLISFVGEAQTKSGGTVKLFSVLVPPDVALLEPEREVDTEDARF
jgi:hypothetical protein